MEAIKLSYRILFTLELALEGYHEDLNQYLKVVPDPATAERFSTYRILRRKQKSSSVSLIEVEPDGAEQGRPVVLPVENELFRFQLKFSDPQFMARTHLASYDFTNEVLVLSNEADHIEGTQMLLSKPIEAYDSSHEYKKGYLVRSGSNYFVAIQESNAGNAHSVTETDFWRSIADGSFVSQADLQSRSSSFDLDTIIVIEIKHHTTLPAAYQLLDSSSKCKEVSYRIKFLKNS